MHLSVVTFLMPKPKLGLKFSVDTELNVGGKLQGITTSSYTSFLISYQFTGLAPIHLASLTGSCEVVQSLLEMGADIDLKVKK